LHRDIEHVWRSCHVYQYLDVAEVLYRLSWCIKLTSKSNLHSFSTWCKPYTHAFLPTLMNYMSCMISTRGCKVVSETCHGSDKSFRCWRICSNNLAEFWVERRWVFLSSIIVAGRECHACSCKPSTKICYCCPNDYSWDILVLSLRLWSKMEILRISRAYQVFYEFFKLSFLWLFIKRSEKS